MADSDHVERLRQGSRLWNTWRDRNPDIRPDLRGVNFYQEDVRGKNFYRADFRNAYLARVNFREADLREANFEGAVLDQADLSFSNLKMSNLTRSRARGANFRGATLWSANLFDAELTGAIFYKADCYYADFSDADLKRADFQQANLRAADLVRSDLSGSRLQQTNFEGAAFFETIFSNVDISAAINLDKTIHYGPSVIEPRTLFNSDGIPDEFLRGCGLPETLIERLETMKAVPLQYYSCFISYSTEDAVFVQKLYSDLQEKRVRCWFAPQDMKVGAEIRVTLDGAIRERDKLLLVLSKSSIGRPWVKREIEQALDEEMRSNRPKLFPIRLDDTVFDLTDGWASDVRRRHIGDFRDWAKADLYANALGRLLRDLKMDD